MMSRKQQLALVGAVVMAQHNGKMQAKDAVQIADYLLTETELAVECYIPN
jgi:mono/diheme cytochrome c family protein